MVRKYIVQMGCRNSGSAIQHIYDSLEEAEGAAYVWETEVCPEDGEEEPWTAIYTIETQPPHSTPLTRVG